jgi:hypothetical protein
MATASSARADGQGGDKVAYVSLRIPEMNLLRRMMLTQPPKFVPG